MNRSLHLTVLASVVCLCVAPVNAQLPQIRLAGLFPLGGQQGTSVDVTIVSGTDLDEVSELIFSGAGLTATPKLDGKGKAVVNQFTVTIEAGVPAGLYDVRARGLFGISNPRIFRVDTIGEVQEAEPNNAAEEAQEIALNTVVNARANSGADVDVFQVQVAAMQTIVVRSEAAVLDSLMQPVLELFDSNGRRVAQSRRRRQRDAVIVYTSPSEQKLLLKVHDTVYLGGNDYGYRLVIDTRPLVDFTTPSVLQAGVESKVMLYGRHLPGGQVTEQLLHGTPLSKMEVNVVAKDNGSSVGADSAAAAIDTVVYSGVEANLLRFGLNASAVPVVVEPENSEEVCEVSVPANINGSFEAAMDADVFRFSATKGQQWQIDVFAQRLGSAADPVLVVDQVVKSAEGVETLKRLTRQDDGPQNPGGKNLPTLTSDPAWMLKVPADGVYQIRLTDRYGVSRGDASLRYTISIQTAQPSMRVVMFDSLPSTDGKAAPTTGAVSLRKGGTYTVPVYAYRASGHNAEIRITATGLPDGVTASDAVIPAGKTETALVLTAAADAQTMVRSVVFTATSEGASETQVKVATLVHAGANGLPRTARVADSLLVAVMQDEEPFYLIPAVTDLQVNQDQQLLIPLKLTRRAGFTDKVDVSFAGQPGNVDVPKVAFEKAKDAAVARFFFKDKAAVGSATLLMYATAKVAYRRNPWLSERAKAKVAEAAALLKAEQQGLADAKAAVVAGTKAMGVTAEQVVALQQDIKVSMVAEKKLQANLKTTIASQTNTTLELLALQKKLSIVTDGLQDDIADVDAAIRAITESAVSVQTAVKPVEDVIAGLQQLAVQVKTKQQDLLLKNKQIADLQLSIKTGQQKVKLAEAAVAAAGAKLKTREAGKKAADAAAKKAADSSKAKSLSLRTIAVPVRLQVHLTPGKIAASVPDGGAIKKGASIDVEVTVTRKNKFQGPVKVALVLPDGVTNVSSNVVDIAADQTVAILRLTATADSAALDIANAVVQASAEFNGRTARFDVPVKLKVTE